MSRPRSTSFRSRWTLAGIYRLPNRIQTSSRDTFVVFFIALLHGVYSGTDSVQLWAKLMYWSSGLAVVLLTTWRFMEAGKPATAKQQRKPAAKPASLAGGR